MPSADDFIAEAASQIGHYGDYNKYNEWYWCDICGYDYDPGYAWCSAFQSWVADRVGLDCSYSAASAYFGGQFPRVYEPQRGDFVLFNWDGRSDQSWTDHIGVVEWVDGGYFGTIEGNTNYGDVARCTRTQYGGYYVAFYRPSWDGESGGGDVELNELLNRKIAVADGDAIPVWQAWSWAYTWAKRDHDELEKLEKQVAELQKKVATVSTGGVDAKAIAKAVNDDAAARMKA